MTKQELGKFGEELAQKHILNEGYRICDLNYRFMKYEIDIVAEKDGKIVIIEVKTRQTAEIGEPWMAVTRQKQRRIIQVANQYMKYHKINKNVRFDVISIVHNQYRSKLEHLMNAFSTY